MDRLLAPDHPSRPRAMYCATSQVRRVPAGKHLPRRGQDVVNRGNPQDSQAVSGEFTAETLRRGEKHTKMNRARIIATLSLTLIAATALMAQSAVITDPTQIT